MIKKKAVLIDAIYINNGGGLILLKYLIEKLNTYDLEVFFLLDNRTRSIFKNIDESSKDFLPNSIKQRSNFYKKNSHKFNSVLCFGNVPPPIKLNIPVFVYFHQLLFLNIPNNFSFKNKVIYTIKQWILKFYKNNATVWLTQSNLVKDKLSKKYFYGKAANIEVIPFYPPLPFLNLKKVERQKNSFLYVSNYSPHKNHKKLIDAFCDAYDKTKSGQLLVTVPDSAIFICEFVNRKIELGYPIINTGFVDREKLVELYLSHEYLIFPSLAESFGLGLVEAIDCGCKVLVSDLPYAYQVCEPSLAFNPYLKESIENAIIMATVEDIPISKKIISNDIDQLLLLLSE